MSDDIPEATGYHFTEGIKKIVQAGRSVIPLSDLILKKPAVKWTPFQSERADLNQIVTWFSGQRQYPGVAVVTGYVSGNLQGLDFDVKNDGGVSHTAWLAEVERRVPGLVARLVQERSRSGGMHYYFTCPEIAGGVTLAFTEPQDELDLKTGKTRKVARPLIETKENGRYMACYPTSGYKLLRGSLTNVPEVTAAEREAMHDAARMQNRNIKQEDGGKRYTSGDGLPGTDYSKRATVADVLALLVEADWSEVRRDGADCIWLCRPGKSDGSISANLKLVDGAAIFFVYSSSCEPFTEMKGHNAFTVLAFLKYGGDFKACANALRDDGYGDKKDDEKDKRPDQWEIAYEFVRLHRDKWAFDEQGDTWRSWNGTYWAKEQSVWPRELFDNMGNFIRNYGRTRIYNVGTIHSALSMVKKKLEQDFTHGED